MCSSHRPEEGADSAPVQEIDIGHCPLCGAEEPPAMHAVLGHKPQIEHKDHVGDGNWCIDCNVVVPTIFRAVLEPDGYWVKDQHGSYYEGPYDTEEYAAGRAELFRKDMLKP